MRSAEWTEKSINETFICVLFLVVGLASLLFQTKDNMRDKILSNVENSLLDIYRVPCFKISSRCSIGIIDEHISLNIPSRSLREEVDYVFWSKKLSLTDLDLIGGDMRQLLPRHPCGGFGLIGRDVWPHLLTKLTKLTAFILSFCKIMMHKSFRETPWRTRHILLFGPF